MSIGVRLKKLRLTKNQSLQQVADAVESSKAHIWELETGKSSNPSMTLLTRLAEHFEVSTAYLVGEDVGADEGPIGTMFRQVRDELEPDDQELIKSVVDKLVQRQRDRGDAD
ncbi:MAG: helix-turn-helix transcriptional regulator [Dehalococcoidia bacterium]|nr:helix-turn-helix transcriptional regulator [Dehalococcoidia bacterium]